VLDVGTGTGLTAHFARRAAGPEGLVIGIDPSTGMLARARESRALCVVAAMAPGLPFPAEVFDAALANLVLSHTNDLGEALADIVGTLRRDGSFGATAWAPPTRADAEADQQAEANHLIARVAHSLGVETDPPFPGAPWEDFLRDRTAFASALGTAGLHQIVIEARSYAWTFTIDDFLAGWGGQARYLRHSLDPARNQELHEATDVALRARFGATITAVSAVWLATARRS
jgi:SAM-dependent methyltransferase